MNEEYVAVSFERPGRFREPVQGAGLDALVLPTDRRSGMRQPITTFDEFRDALSAYRLPRVILAALELKLFTVIGKDTWTLPDLARELKVSERGLSILCRNLAMAGIAAQTGQNIATAVWRRLP